MAKLVIEVEDPPDGALAVRFSCDDLAAAVTMPTNTAAQNVAILSQGNSLF